MRKLVLTATIVSGVLAIFSDYASALDVVRLKSGDAYRGQILTQKFGEFIQLVMKDGSERRILWKDVDSIEHEATPSSRIETGAAAGAAPHAPSESISVQESNPARVEFDLNAWSYSSQWVTSKTTYTDQVKEVNKDLITVRPNFQLRLYQNRWAIHLVLATGKDGASGMIATTYAPIPGVQLGLAFLNHQTSASTASGTTTKLTSAGSYIPAAFGRLVLPTSSSNAVEGQIALGPEIASISSNTPVNGVSVNGVGILLALDIQNAFMMTKNFGYLIGSSLSYGSISMSGDISNSPGTAAVPGAWDVERVKWNIMPVGLRIAF